jgi:hypothetical protein
MTVTTNEYGQQNLFAKEPPMTIMDVTETHRTNHPRYLVMAPKKKKATKTRLDPSCWKGYKKSGTKVKGGTRVNNCVKIKK